MILLAVLVPTFIFADVFECERQTSIFALNNADFAKSAFANDPEKFEMIELHCSVSLIS